MIIESGQEPVIGTEGHGDDGAEVGPLPDQVTGSVASFTADGAYDQNGVSTAVPSETAQTGPTQRNRHLHSIAEHGRAAWQKASGYTKRARAEAAIGRFKQVIGDGRSSRTDRSRATEVDVAAHALNRMLELGRLISVPIALPPSGTGGNCAQIPGQCNTAPNSSNSSTYSKCDSPGRATLYKPSPGGIYGHSDIGVLMLATGVVLSLCAPVRGEQDGRRFQAGQGCRPGSVGILDASSTARRNSPLRSM